MLCLLRHKIPVSGYPDSQRTSVNPNSLSIGTAQKKSFKILQLPLLSRELGLIIIIDLNFLQDKAGSHKNIYPYMLQELRPTLDELNISTPEELGLDKPQADKIM